jgi:hypothetical protein
LVNLKELAQEHRYRIILDESATEDRERAHRVWYYRIKCKYGHIYVHGEDRLGAYCDHPRVWRGLLEVPGVRKHQLGDTELTVTFPPPLLAEVATVLRARTRSVRTPEQKHAARARLAPFQFPKHAQKHTVTARERVHEAPMV